jgi:hypothetical protein
MQPAALHLGRCERFVRGSVGRARVGVGTTYTFVAAMTFCVKPFSNFS